ncbi:ataxin-3-like isoform X2 [Dendronephthya gigantea]|uniref:ataxin-3-like isoform X2 n=2 Tax=Dendronephthya gigantea TaxID=151771 RepID=UPI00106D3F4C|nr:ataxin-3-like isoform X2 [Dendronephthya gigantea]
MDYIHFEKQDGSLCAQHCLNSLLQGPYFTAVDLAQHAVALDEAERQMMEEGDVNSDDYVKFMNVINNVHSLCTRKHLFLNTMFSEMYIQVICRALEVWNLSAIPYSSPSAESARLNPGDEKAFICNLQQHWFTIRKLGKQWFNLDSCASGPELISETYLSLFLTQVQNEGYSIFVVRGVFPDCESDQMLSVIPVDPTKVKSTSTRGKLKNKAKNDAAKTTETKKVDVDEVRKKREEFFSTRFTNDQQTSSAETNETINSHPHRHESEETEEEMLKRALALSLTQT